MDVCALKDNEHYLEIPTYVGVVVLCLQLLGSLPQFSQKNPASFKSNPLQFDDELDSLLNDDVQLDYHDTGILAILATVLVL